MRIGLVFGLMFVFASASAQSVAVPAAAKTLCTLSAAEKLPRIQGLEINASRVERSVSNGNAFQTELDVHAAGIDVTFIFLCARGDQGPMITTFLNIRSFYLVASPPQSAP
jgi:hypothetical protein